MCFHFVISSRSICSIPSPPASVCLHLSISVFFQSFSPPVLLPRLELVRSLFLPIGIFCCFLPLFLLPLSLCQLLCLIPPRPCRSRYLPLISLFTSCCGTGSCGERKRDGGGAFSGQTETMQTENTLKAPIITIFICSL